MFTEKQNLYHTTYYNAETNLFEFIPILRYNTKKYNKLLWYIFYNIPLLSYIATAV